MTKTTTLLFLLCGLSSQAQTSEFAIYAPSKDSFFLVETVTGAASKDVPRPSETENSILFRSEAQLLDYIQYLRNQAAQAEKEAEKAVQFTINAKKAIADAETNAKRLREAAPRIKTAAEKIEAVAVKNRDVLRGKKVEEKPTTKPKKKKKQ